MQAPGDLLLDVCQQAQREVLLVAPFVKLNTLQRILDVIADDVSVQCVTRWRPDEIAAGVSDIEIWPVIKERRNALLWLRTDLHAKYYRGDQRTLVGSANLTKAALGWSQHPNLELLVESPPLSRFESMLFGSCINVDNDIYEYTRRLVTLFPQQSSVKLAPENNSGSELVASQSSMTPLNAWLPTLRHPEKLYFAYRGHLEELGSGSLMAALNDLEAFDVPIGFSREQFEAYIGQQLLQKTIVQAVDKFAQTPQRFGRVRDYLYKLIGSFETRADADVAWQTLMRWMLFFLPHRYNLNVPSHSDIFSRRTIHS